MPRQQATWPSWAICVSMGWLPTFGRADVCAADNPHRRGGFRGRRVSYDRRRHAGRNVARDPRCSVAVSVRDADVVIEGDAARVTEPGALACIAKAWADSGWPAEPDYSGPGITAPFNAPSQGPPPWNVYRIEPRSAIVTLGTEPGGLTRFRF